MNFNINDDYDALKLMGVSEERRGELEHLSKVIREVNKAIAENIQKRKEEFRNEGYSSVALLLRTGGYMVFTYDNIKPITKSEYILCGHFYAKATAHIEKILDEMSRNHNSLEDLFRSFLNRE